MYITTIISTGYCGTVEMLSARDADNKHDKHAVATMGHSWKFTISNNIND